MSLKRPKIAPNLASDGLLKIRVYFWLLKYSKCWPIGYPEKENWGPSEVKIQKLARWPYV